MRKILIAAGIWTRVEIEGQKSAHNVRLALCATEKMHEIFNTLYFLLRGTSHITGQKFVNSSFKCSDRSIEV